MRQRGIGKLISTYKPDNENKIAIHYSYPSIHGAWITDGKISAEKESSNTSNTLEQFRRNLDGWVKVLHDAGVGFDFIAYSSIEEDDLITRGYKVLVLPMSIALSDKEVEAIDKFTQQGGIVIADALTGVMDGHTKYRGEQALAAVFGIAPQTHTRQDLTTPFNDSKLLIKDAVMLGKKESSPELLVHNYGKGKAFMLNYFLDNYPRQKLDKQADAPLDKIRTVLAAAGIASGIEITDAAGKPVSGVTKYSFSEEKGGGKLLGLLPEEGITDSVITIHLKDSVHLYNVRSGAYAGYGSRFSLAVTPGVPQLFGLIKDAVSGLQVNAPAAIKAGEKVNVQVKCTGGSNLQLNSIAAIEVYNPDGVLMQQYGSNISIHNNQGVFAFTTALNDEAGVWTIKIREAISNQTKDIKVVLQ